MKIYVRTSKPRKEHFAGERRITKKYGEQIRVQEYSDMYKAWVVDSNGKPRYIWKSLDNLDKYDRRYLTKEERELYYEKDNCWYNGYRKTR